MNYRLKYVLWNVSVSFALHYIDGYWVTSKLLTSGMTVDNLTGNNRLTLAMANKLSVGRCISSTDKGSKYLILPVYESMTTIEVKYQVRYIVM